MEIRLVDGPSRCSGRVEVFHQQQWGTVCDDGWDLRDAEVVCRETGCGAAMEAPGSARFGRGRDPIWLDEVNCTGSESALSECGAKPKGDPNCYHGEDAGAVCSGSCSSSAGELLGTNTAGAPGPVFLASLRGCSFPMGILLSLRVERPWHRLRREAVAAPALEVFEARLGGALSKLLCWKVSLPVAGGLELDDR